MPYPLLASWVIEPGPQPALEFIVSVIVLAGGVGVFVVYLVGRSAATADRKDHAGGKAALLRVGGRRPWRKLGAVICLLLSVMFVLGLYGLNQDTPRNVFVAYWLIMLVLVIWLLGLALRDVRYTRRVVSGYRKGTMTLSGEPVPPPQPNRDEPPSE